nr:alpha/beta hydrolase [Gracilibacillus dipsosauri]
MRRKTWIKLSFALISILLIIDLIAGNFFYDLAIKREKKEFLQGNEDLTVSTAAMDVFLKGDWRSWVANQDFEQWQLESYDGLHLNGYFLEAKKPTNKTVILAHGYLGDAMDMGLYGQYYYEELGYNIFTADLRGHGGSEGDYIGFGWHDRLDYLDWTDKVINRVGKDAEIVVHGLSMGASTVLMMSGERLPENIKAIISDSAYTSVYDLFKYQMNRMYHLPAFPILPTTSLITSIRADYSLKEASALEQVKKANVPILYFHGKNDDFVPTKMASKLYQNTEKAEIMLFAEASHGEAYAIYREQYQTKLTEFLTKYMR